MCVHARQKKLDCFILARRFLDPGKRLQKSRDEVGSHLLWKMIDVAWHSISNWMHRPTFAREAIR